MSAVNELKILIEAYSDLIDQGIFRFVHVAFNRRCYFKDLNDGIVNITQCISVITGHDLRLLQNARHVVLLDPFQSLGEIIQNAVQERVLRGAGAMFRPFVLPQGILVGIAFDVCPIFLQVGFDRCYVGRVEMYRAVTE